MVVVSVAVYVLLFDKKASGPTGDIAYKCHYTDGSFINCVGVGDSGESCYAVYGLVGSRPKDGIDVESAATPIKCVGLTSGYTHSYDQAGKFVE